jgi:site-specific recombinase XerD
MAGKIFVFEHRLDQHRSRTRQAVWKDLKRIARAFRLKPNLAPHSARKVWAVAQYRKNGSLARVQKLMNHSSASVTTLYALADQLTKRKRGPL